MPILIYRYFSGNSASSGGVFFCGRLFMLASPDAMEDSLIVQEIAGSDQYQMQPGKQVQSREKT